MAVPSMATVVTKGRRRPDRAASEVWAVRDWMVGMPTSWTLKLIFCLTWKLWKALRMRTIQPGSNFKITLALCGKLNQVEERAE